jgi:hypothetical protein
MENFIIALTAKPGAEDNVTDFYLSQEADYKDAKGFRGRSIYRAKAGTMVAAVKKRISAEELAKHPEQHHGEEKGVHFVIVEQWDSVDDRMNFSMGRDKSRDRVLFPNLMPEHTHEFYGEVNAE